MNIVYLLFVYVLSSYFPFTSLFMFCLIILKMLLSDNIVLLLPYNKNCLLENLNSYSVNSFYIENNKFYFKNEIMSFNNMSILFRVFMFSVSLISLYIIKLFNNINNSCYELVCKYDFIKQTLYKSLKTFELFFNNYIIKSRNFVIKKIVTILFNMLLSNDNIQNDSKELLVFLSNEFNVLINETEKIKKINGVYVFNPIIIKNENNLKNEDIIKKYDKNINLNDNSSYNSDDNHEDKCLCNHNDDNCDINGDNKCDKNGDNKDINFIENDVNNIVNHDDNNEIKLEKTMMEKDEVM